MTKAEQQSPRRFLVTGATAFASDHARTGGPVAALSFGERRRQSKRHGDLSPPPEYNERARPKIAMRVRLLLDPNRTASGCP